MFPRRENCSGCRLISQSFYHGSSMLLSHRLQKIWVKKHNTLYHQEAGVLRFLLTIHHSFPVLLADNHYVTNILATYKREKASHTSLTLLSPINLLLEGHRYTFLITQERVSSPSTAHMSRRCMYPSFPFCIIIQVSTRLPSLSSILVQNCQTM